MALAIGWMYPVTNEINSYHWGRGVSHRLFQDTKPIFDLGNGIDTPPHINNLNKFNLIAVCFSDAPLKPLIILGRFLNTR